MRALALCLLAATGCLRGTEFRCALDSDCGAAGTCEPIGFCSLPNTACPGTGRSYSDTAGNLANTCVAGGNPGPGPDAGIDAPPLDSDTRCPPDYAPVGASAHRYKALTNISWDEARTACKVAAFTYLAIPDDAAELTTITTAAAAPVWIGIDNKDDDNTFVTQKATTATFLPWAPGQPNVGAPPAHCVDATSSTEIALDRCGTKHAAVCECEP